MPSYIDTTIQQGGLYDPNKKYEGDVVYLIHFDRPYMHAQHYLGYSHNFDARMERHHAGRGSRLLDVIQKAGIGWKVVRIWQPGSPRVEAELKRYKNNKRLCPICSGEFAFLKAEHLREMRKQRKLK